MDSIIHPVIHRHWTSHYTGTSVFVEDGFKGFYKFVSFYHSSNHLCKMFSLDGKLSVLKTALRGWPEVFFRLFYYPRLAYFTLIISRLLTCLFYESTINKLLSIESFWASYDQFFFPQGVNAEKWTHTYTHTYIYLCLRVFICVIWRFIHTIELNCIVKLYNNSSLCYKWTHFSGIRSQT